MLVKVNQQKVHVNPGNGLAHNYWQVITWFHDDQVQEFIEVYKPKCDELKKKSSTKIESSN